MVLFKMDVYYGALCESLVDFIGTWGKPEDQTVGVLKGRNHTCYLKFFGGEVE